MRDRLTNTWCNLFRIACPPFSGSCDVLRRIAKTSVGHTRKESLAVCVHTERCERKEIGLFQTHEHLFFFHFFHLELNQTCWETGYIECLFCFLYFCLGLTGGIASACCATNISMKPNALKTRIFFPWYWQLSMLLREVGWWLQEPGSSPSVKHDTISQLKLTKAQEEFH